MKSYLTLACQHLGIDEGQVVDHRIDKAKGEIYVLVDRGILGIPKYTLSLAELVEEESKVEDLAPKALNYKSMSIRNLKIEARKAKIPRYSKMSKAKLIEALEALE